MSNDSLSSSFSHQPGEDIHHYFRNILKEFQKIITNSENIDELEAQMETVINAVHDMPWNETNHEIAKKPESEKLFDKLFDEFRRYIESLEKDIESTNNEELLLTLEEIMDLYTQR